MARNRDRIIALVLAITFFATSVGVSVLVIWELVRGDDKTTTVTNEVDMGPKLKGTKLADFTPVAKVDSLQIVDLQVGTGEAATAQSTVVADYTGADADTGIIFESSLDAGKPLTRPLSGLIVGWQEGIPGMKVGGKRRIIIPSDKAYGEGDMVFDITLHSLAPAQ